MRFDKKIYFVVGSTEEVYDPETSTYKSGEQIRTEKYANINDLGLEESVKVFGDYNSTRKIVRLQRPYTSKFDHREDQGEKYHIKFKRQENTVFYVEGDSLH